MGKLIRRPEYYQKGNEAFIRFFNANYRLIPYERLSMDMQSDLQMVWNNYRRPKGFCEIVENI
jgi:hypothetical protein